MTAKKRIVINAKRHTKAAKGAVKNAQRKLSHAELQEQLAEREEQLAEREAQIAEQQARIAVLTGESPVASGGPSQTQSAERKSNSKRKVRSIESKIEQKFAEIHALNSELDAALDSAHDAALDSAHDAAFDSAHDAKTRANPDKSPFSPFSPSSASSASFARLRAKAQVRANLPAPVLGDLVVNGQHSITIHWSPVANASAYIVSVADNSTFDEANLFSAGPAATSWTVNGLLADTTYYVRVRANGSGEYGNSAYSASKSIATTGEGSGEIPGGGGGGNGGGESGETDLVVGELQNWLSELQTLFQNVSQFVPQIDHTVLDAPERRRLLGSGVRRYGHIEKIFEVSQDYPQFWPAFVEDGNRLSELVREIDVLRNLLILFQYYTRVVGDLLLLAGDDAFRMAGSYYATVRDSARRKIPEAAAVYAMLRSFWRRRRRAMAEPTEKEIMRDAKGLMHGTKDGDLTLCNESDHIVKGKKVMIDNTFPAKQRASAKVVEEEEEMWE